MSSGFVMLPGEGRLLDMGSFEALVIVDDAQTDGSFSLIQTRREPSGFGPPPGSFVYVPRGLPHTFKVVSEEAGRRLNLFSPAAMVGFFEALARAQASGEATPDLLGRIAEEHDMEVLGPVPDSYL